MNFSGSTHITALNLPFYKAVDLSFCYGRKNFVGFKSTTLNILSKFVPYINFSLNEKNYFGFNASRRANISHIVVKLLFL